MLADQRHADVGQSAAPALRGFRLRAEAADASRVPPRAPRRAVAVGADAHYQGWQEKREPGMCFRAPESVHSAEMGRWVTCSELSVLNLGDPVLHCVVAAAEFFVSRTELELVDDLFAGTAGCVFEGVGAVESCLLYTSPSPRDRS